MSIVIKNIRKFNIPVGQITLAPGEQFSCQELTDDIKKAFIRGDISVTDPAELKSNADC